MDSRLRASSQSPGRNIKGQLTKIHYPAPDERQFIAYSYVDKESTLGMTANQRLLLFDSMTMTLRYYSKIPDPLPHPELPLLQGKDTVFIKKSRNFQFKSTKTGIGKAVVKWSGLNMQNGEKKFWNLKFKNNHLMNEWVVIVNETLTSGHKHPENRPRDLTVRSGKKDIQKYQTPFMAQTGGIQSRRNSVVQSSIQGNIRSRENSSWLTETINESEKQIYRKHRELHNIQPQEQKREANIQKQKMVQKEQKQPSFLPIPPPALSTTGSDKTIKKPQAGMKVVALNHPAIEQKQDESKVSKEGQINHSDSSKFFRVNRPPPAQIPQVAEQSMVQEPNSKQITVQQKDQKGSTQQMQQENGLKQKQKAIVQNILSNIKNQTETKQNFKQIEQQQPYWALNNNSPYMYYEFVNFCQKIAISLIDNLPQLLQKAKARQASDLYFTSDSLTVVKNKISFTIGLALASQWQSSLELKQYTSIVGYINRISNDRPRAKQTITALPYCSVNYKWHEVKCKAIVNEKTHKKMTDKQSSNALDKFFNMPFGLWTYYYAEENIVVDYAKEGSIFTQIEQKALEEIALSLCQQDPTIGHIKDLQLFCSSRHDTVLNPQTIARILSKTQSISPGLPPNHTLISILQGIKIGSYIKSQLFAHILSISSAQLTEQINSIIRMLVMQKSSTDLHKQLQAELQQELKNSGVNGVDIEHNIDRNCVLVTLGWLLGMEVTVVGSRRELGKFVPMCYQIGARALSGCMERVYQILGDHQFADISQEKKYIAYLEIEDILNQFQSLWVPPTSTPKFKTTNPSHIKQKSFFVSFWRKYQNLYYRIFHYKSLYQAYSLPQHRNEDNIYCLELQKIINENPPTYYGYMIGINCIKWVGKRGLGSADVVEDMVLEQVEKCRKWSGARSLFLLPYFQLYSVYNQQIFNTHRAIQYARYALQLVNQVYGEWSAEAAQRWFLLGNTMTEDQDQYWQALQAHQKALRILSQQASLQTPLTASKTSLFLYQSGTQEAILTIRLKIIKLLLTLNQISKCLQQCSQCVELSQRIANPNPHSQLQIFSTIIKCLQLSGEDNKLLLILETTAQKFGLRMLAHHQQYNEDILVQEQELREEVLRICLAPYIKLRITDPNRLLYLLKLLQTIWNRYERRYNKKQYNTYLTKLTRTLPPDNNLIEWLLSTCEQVPIFSTYMRSRTATQEEEMSSISYNLYESVMDYRLQATQNKLTVGLMRGMEAVAGVVGYGYLLGCFQA